MNKKLLRSLRRVAINILDKFWHFLGWLIIGVLATSLIGNFAYDYTKCTPKSCDLHFTDPRGWPLVILMLHYPLISSVTLAVCTIFALCAYFAHCYLHPLVRNANSILYSTISAIPRNLLNLGNDQAAHFPFVSAPIQNEYDNLLLCLQRNAKGNAKDTIFILGEANSGKTRLVLEALDTALPRWHILLWKPECTIESLPAANELEEQDIVLFLDDLQYYISMESETDVDAAIIPTSTKYPHAEIFTIFRHVTSPPVERLSKMLRNLRSLSGKLVIIATCQLEEKERVFKEFQNVLDFNHLECISLPSFPLDSQNVYATQIISAFESKGACFSKQWNGKLGSLVLGLNKEHEKYLLTLVPHQRHSVAILHAMKLLWMAGIPDHSEKRVKAVCTDVLDDNMLQNDDRIWKASVEYLKHIEFIESVAEKDIHQQAVRLIISKDLYFQEVITDYPVGGSTSPSTQQQLEELGQTLTRLQDVPALLNLGIKFSEQERYEQAENVLASALRFHPALLAGWLYIGVVRYNLGNSSGALEAFNKVVESDSTLAQAWFNKGSLHLIRGENKEALEANKEAIAFDTSNVLAHYNKSIALFQLHRYSEALVAINRALSLDPDFVIALVSKAKVLVARNEVEKALDVLNVALTSKKLTDNKLRIDVLMEKADVLSRLEHYREELAVYRRVLEINPSSSLAAFRKAATLKKLKKYEEALAAYDDVLQLNSEDFVDALNNKALVFKKMGRFEEALQCIDDALNYAPRNGEFWDSKGEIYLAQNQYQDALEAFEQAMQYDPDNDRFQRNADTAHKYVEGSKQLWRFLKKPEQKD